MKNLLIFLAFSCLAVPSFGQFSIGISTGPNVAQMKWHIHSPEFNLDYEPAIGWRAALLGEWQLLPQLALRTELGGQLKSSQLELTNSEGNKTGYLRQNFQYWEGSILLQVAPLKTYKNLYVLTGCTAGRLTNVWERASKNINEGGQKKKNIALDQGGYNRNAVAADFGIGGNLPLNVHSSIKLEGRYQFGLLDFSSREGIDARLNPLFISVGYLYQL